MGKYVKISGAEDGLPTTISETVKKFYVGQKFVIENAEANDIQGVCTRCPLTLELKAKSGVRFQNIERRVDGTAKVGILYT